MVRHLLLSAHAEIQERCHGAGLTSAVVAIGSGTAREMAVGSVGDCQAVLFDGTDAKLLIEPDRDAQVRRQNGTTAIVDGVPLIDRGLSQAIGQVGAALQIATREVGYPDDGSALCLTSDGVRLGPLRQFLLDTPFEFDGDNVSAFCTHASETSSDDACLVIGVLEEPRGLVTLRAGLREFASLGAEARREVIRQIQSVRWRPRELWGTLQAEADERNACSLLELAHRVPGRAAA